MRSWAVVLSLLVTAACATAPDRTPSPDGPSDVQAPRIIHKVEAEYPLELRRQRVTGTVMIEGTIDKAGHLVEPRVVRSADPRLDDLALDAVRQWRFAPGTLNGEPVDVLFTVEVHFHR